MATTSPRQKTEGTLLKWGGKIKKAWKPYRFELNRANFQYFKPLETNKPKKQTLVYDILSSEEKADPQGNIFPFIVNFRNNSSWTLAATCEDDRQKWMMAVKPVVPRPSRAVSTRGYSRTPPTLGRTYSSVNACSDPRGTSRGHAPPLLLANQPRHEPTLLPVKRRPTACEVATQEVHEAPVAISTMDSTNGEHLYDTAEDPPGCDDSEYMVMKADYTADSEYVEMRAEWSAAQQYGNTIRPDDTLQPYVNMHPAPRMHPAP